MYVDKDINVKKISHWGDYLERKKVFSRCTKSSLVKTQQSTPFNRKSTDCRGE